MLLKAICLKWGEVADIVLKRTSNNNMFYKKSLFSAKGTPTTAVQEVRRHRVACVVRQAVTELVEVITILH